MAKAIMSSVGPDRPGIVAALGEVLLQWGCNIEDSTMTRLGNEFATILLLNVPDTASLEGLKAAFSPIEQRMGMTVVIKPMEEKNITAQAPARPYMISVGGHDRTGITYYVSKVLAEHQVNITDLDAHIIEGEGGPVYIMMIEVNLPETLTPEDLKASLASLEQQLQVEIQLRPMESVAL